MSGALDFIAGALDMQRAMTYSSEPPIADLLLDLFGILCKITLGCGFLVGLIVYRIARSAMMHLLRLRRCSRSAAVLTR